MLRGKWLEWLPWFSMEGQAVKAIQNDTEIKDMSGPGIESSVLWSPALHIFLTIIYDRDDLDLMPLWMYHIRSPWKYMALISLIKDKMKSQLKLWSETVEVIETWVLCGLFLLSVSIFDILLGNLRDCRRYFCILSRLISLKIFN